MSVLHRASIIKVSFRLDGYMNIALEQTEKHIDGAVISKYEDVFICWNNDPL
ncbi:uncharacterized protein BJ212DRAFT_1397143 [Suillus subaureus]|uniref:LSM domain-containing protein n=1 Tax=Suillus subaureus TaxID=48587 RepID=A0A9P7DTZ1_9AGAM|nr:uncharacterized protein BJ212DRAFT_1397143 [Suillus subaureus]KAG1803021.1 hypothetical protein BJ212DRAFT_1397143 [Suillus subaureus]